MAPTDVTDISSGLVAHYDFETVNGTTVVNKVSSNTSTTATLNGSAAIEDTDFMGKAMHLTGGALQLSNVVNAAESSFSVSMWYKFDADHASNSNNVNMVQAGTISGSVGRTIVILTPESKYYTYVTADNSKVTTNTVVNRSEWQHITFCYDKDAGKAYYYINGVADNAEGVTISGTAANTADMIIGRHREDGQGQIYGLVDEVCVYNKVLSAEEAADLYARNKNEFTNWVNGGQYYIQNARAEYNNANSWLRAENDTVVSTTKENATLFTLGFLDNGNYTLSYDDNGTTKYLYLNTSLSDKGVMDGFSTTAQELTIEYFITGTVTDNGSTILEDDGHFIRIGSNGKYLGQFGGTTVTTYGAEDSATDSGIAMWFHRVVNGTSTKVTYVAADDSRDIPAANTTPTAGSSNSDNEAPSKVTDGDTTTIWHTDHGGDATRDTHWITFELKGDYVVDGLRYLPRQTGVNGTITGYEIQVSDDGESFRTIKSGTWANNKEWKIAEFDGVHTRYVRLKVTNAHGNFASAAEIRLTGERYTAPEELTLAYFPVTMFNYNTSKINTATHIRELELAREAGTEITEWNGLYFSDGTPSAGYTGPTGEYTEVNQITVSYELVTPQISNGGINLNETDDYILVNKRSGFAVAIGEC